MGQGSEGRWVTMAALSFEALLRSGECRLPLPSQGSAMRLQLDLVRGAALGPCQAQCLEWSCCSVSTAVRNYPKDTSQARD